MPYNAKANKISMKYVKEKQRRIDIKYKKDEYENFIFPAIQKSGLPTATFIKQAIAEKIERDGLQP